MDIDKKLQDILKIADTVSHNAHMEESFGFCVELAKDIFNAPCVAVILLDESTEDIFIRTARGLSYTFIKEYRRPIGKDIMAEVLRAQNTILINDITPDNKFYSDLKLEYDYHSIMITPVTYDQHAEGILYICHSEKKHFQAIDRTLFTLLGHLLGFAVQKDKLITLARKLATNDEKAPVLTYPYFRERLQYEITRAREFSYPLSVILFDIDHYKKYREIHGDKAGESLYKQIVELIKEHLDEIDLIGRHGLDEIIICRPQSGYNETREIAGKILENIKPDFADKGEQITLSAGIASLNAKTDNLVKLINAVRVGLLQAQRAGRNQVSLVTD